MDTLHKGDRGTQVRKLQQLLAQRGYAVDMNGTFDTKTWQALRAFQTQNLDQHGQPLVVDGVAGPLTWWSLQNPKPFIQTPSTVDYAKLPARGGSTLGCASLAAVIGELKAKTREVGGDNCGPFVHKYLASAALDEGNSWCASFVNARWLGHTDPAHSVQNGMAYTIEGNRSPSEQGFSHVPNRMDKLLGIGRVP